MNYFRIFDDERLTGSEKLVFLVLCKYAGKDYTCFPSIMTIAKKASLSERCVQKALRRLEELGIITTRKQYKMNRQTTNNYVINEGCTIFTPGGASDSPRTIPVEKHNIYIPKGDESREEITNFDQQTQETIKADEIEDMEPKLDDVPSSMIHVAKYFLRETGRKQLLSEDISALREFAAHQVPARVMKAIDDKLKFFAAKGRPANTLSLAYIATVLRNQPTFSRDKGVLKKSQQKQEEAAIKEACRDLNARVITTSQTKWTAEEAQTALDKLNTMLAEMGEI